MWDAIVNAMVKLFNGLHQFIVGLGVPAEREGLSYILAILIFTVIIRLLILPLNIKSTKSNARMQEIQPEMKKLQAKYKNDPQKLQLETSKLMKENNVSMFGGVYQHYYHYQYYLLYIVYSIVLHQHQVQIYLSYG